MSESLLKPCPFCGKDLSEIPIVMSVQRKFPETYLDYLRSKGQFLGSDKGYCVRCIRCGAEGATKTNADRAIEAWNRRAKDVKHGKWEMFFLFGHEVAVCSCCRKDFVQDYETNVEEWNYCPNCGAKMDGKK